MPSWIAVLSTTKASVGHTMIKLAAKPSCASSCTGDNRTMKLLGGLSSLVPTKNEINTVRVHCLPNETWDSHTEHVQAVQYIEVSPSHHNMTHGIRFCEEDACKICCHRLVNCGRVETTRRFSSYMKPKHPVDHRCRENRTAPRWCGRCTHKGSRSDAASHSPVAQSGGE